MTTTATPRSATPARRSAVRPVAGPTSVPARAATAAQRVGTVTTLERRRARIAGAALATVTLLSIPAAALLDDADRPGARAVAGAAFVAIAALEVVVGWGVYMLLRERAHPPAYAALVSRAGYAVLLAAAAGRLVWPGGDGADGFRADWSLALVVLGVHLLVTAVALWRSRRVPGAVVLGTALAGTASVLVDVVGQWPLPDLLPGAGVLLPAALGQLVLLAWLTSVGWDQPVA